MNFYHINPIIEELKQEAKDYEDWLKEQDKILHQENEYPEGEKEFLDWMFSKGEQEELDLVDDF